MLKNLTRIQFGRLKQAVEHHCIKKDHFCDGTSMREDVKKTSPCPYFFKGACTNPNILNIKNTIAAEMERGKKK